jgi:hypothetical protein
MTEGEPQDPARAAEDAAAAQRQTKIVALVGVSVTLLAVIGIVWLFGPGDDSGSTSVDTAKLEQVDGTLVLVEDNKLVMQPFAPLDGQSEIEFTIRERDLQNFDIAHLQSHSAVALPTRIYYEKDGDTYYAVYKEDAPANSAQQ